MRIIQLALAIPIPGLSKSACRRVPTQIGQVLHSTSPGPSGKDNLRNPVPPTQTAPGLGKQF